MLKKKLTKQLNLKHCFCISFFSHGGPQGIAPRRQFSDKITLAATSALSIFGRIYLFKTHFRENWT